MSRAFVLALALAFAPLLTAPALRAEEAPAAEEAAEAAPTWPTVGDMLTNAKPGDFLKYHSEQSQGNQKMTATVWATYVGTADNKVTFDMVMAMREEPQWQPLTEPAADVKKASQSFALDSPFQGIEAPRGSTVTADRVQAAPFSERFGNRLLSGTKYTRTLQVKMPNAMQFSYSVMLWFCPDLPATGLAKYTVSMTNGLMSSTSTQTLVAASDLDPAIAEAQAKAAEEAARAKAEAEKLAAEAAEKKALADATTSVEGALAYSEHSIKQGYRVTTGWVPQYSGSLLDVVNYRVRVGYALQAMGRFEEARDLSKELASGSAAAASFLKYVQAEAAYRGDAAAVAELTALLKDRQRTLSELKTEWFMLNPQRTTNAELITHLRSLKDTKAMDMGLRVAISRWDSYLDQARKQELVDALSSDEEREAFMKSSTWASVDYKPNLQAFEATCELYPAFKSTLMYREMRLTVLAQTGHEDEAKAMLEAYLKSDGITLRRAAKVLEALGDERAAAYRWQVNEELRAMYEKRFAELKGDAKPWPDDVNSYVRVLAALGDRKAAEAAAKTYGMPGHWRAWIDPVVALYGEGGDKAGAIAWRDSFQLTTNQGQGFWLEGLRSEITLGFAEWELKQGNREAYETYLAEATALALKANEGIVAYNAGETDSKKRVWWRVGMTSDNHAPYASVARHLVKQNDRNRLMAFLPQLKDERPTSDSTKQVWEDTAKELAAQGNAFVLAKVLLAAPGGWEENWYTAVLSDTVRLVAVDAGPIWVTQLADGLEKPNWKAEVLRAAIIALANADKQADAATLFAPLKKEVAGKASNTHQAYGALALANGYVRAGKRAEGLAAYRERGTNLSEGMVRRGYNGRAGTAVLEQLGKELATQGATPAELTEWLEATDNLPERAYLALGIAEGLHAKGQ